MRPLPQRGGSGAAWRRRVLLATVLLAGMPALPGCAVYDYLYGGEARRESSRTDQDLLRSAEGEMQRRRYSDARKSLQRLINQYPDSDLVTSARLALARAMYEDRKYDEARNEYQRFLELHPQHERADEAVYYLAMSYFRQSETIDRDQTATQKALEEFQILLKQMPDSQYVGDARERLAVASRKLAQRDLYVAEFYFRQKSYEAALNRCKVLLTEYPGTEVEDAALYYLGESLWQLEQKTDARGVFQKLVDQHSQSDLAPAAADRLGIVLVRTGPPKPKGPGVFERVKQTLKDTWDEFVDTARTYTIFRQQ
jgi:outer membrane protein assembly factor BamD